MFSLHDQFYNVFYSNNNMTQMIGPIIFFSCFVPSQWVPSLDLVISPAVKFLASVFDINICSFTR